MLNELKLSKYFGEESEGFKQSYKVSAYLWLRAQCFFLNTWYLKRTYSVCIMKKCQLLDKNLFFYFKFSERSNEFKNFTRLT